MPKKPKTPERFLLLRTHQHELANIDQGLAVVSMSVEHAKVLIARLEAARAIKSSDSSFFALEFFDRTVEFVSRYRLVAQIRDNFPKGKEANRLADLIEGWTGDSGYLVVESPGRVLSSSVDEYDVDGETSLECQTVIISDDTFQWCALVEYDDFYLKTECVPVGVIRQLAFLDPLDAPKVEARTQ